MSISGVYVDRDCPCYQYALFSCTRLMDFYKDFMFPNVIMSLGSFREDLQDYLDVIEEIYHDLCFEERLLVNGRVSFEADGWAKESVSQLAFRLWKLSTDSKLRTEIADSEKAIDESNQLTEKRGISSDVSYNKVFSEMYEDTKADIQDSECYKYCYEDTLKLLVTDLERKEIWQISTLYSNKEFEALLREQEPETYKEMSEDSITILVPRPLKKKNSNMYSMDDSDSDHMDHHR